MVEKINKHWMFVGKQVRKKIHAVRLTFSSLFTTLHRNGVHRLLMLLLNAINPDSLDTVFFFVFPYCESYNCMSARALTCSLFFTHSTRGSMCACFHLYHRNKYTTKIYAYTKRAENNQGNRMPL